MNTSRRSLSSQLTRLAAALALTLSLFAAAPSAFADRAPTVEVNAEQGAHGEAAAAHGEAGHGAEAGHGGDHRADAKTRPHAPEDKHWWIGKELPVEFRQGIADLLGPSFIDGDTADKLNVGHILFGILAFIIGIGMALAASRKVRGAVIPPRTWSAAAFFDLITEAIMGLMVSMMPREKAVRYLPLVTAAAVFILISNILGLLPGSVPPTQSFNTTLALGLVAFVFYNYQGIKTQGVVKYLKHFMGPMLALAPLMIVIEIISHCVRPLSLGLRLMGNMFGDHQVLFIFMSFGLPLIPIPLMALGLMVCIVQTVVFTLLFIVYVSLAVEEHDHDHDHAEAHDHEHVGHAAHAHA